MNHAISMSVTKNSTRGKAFMRAALHSLHHILPNSLYEALYARAFHLYRRLLHARYARRVCEARTMGHQAMLRRAETVHSVMPYSLVGDSGLELTYDLARHAVDQELPGAFVECGVAQGGSTALIAMVARDEGKHRRCWFFDSYEGLPNPTDQDFAAGHTGDHVRPLPKGSCLGTIEQVSHLLFETFGLSCNDISLIKGWFQDTLPTTRERIGPIALLRLDGDWYESTKCCLEQLYNLVAEGGYIIIDDYDTCYGSAKATDEFRAAWSIATELIPDGRGGRAFQKPTASV